MGEVSFHVAFADFSRDMTELLDNLQDSAAIGGLGCVDGMAFSAINVVRDGANLGIRRLEQKSVGVGGCLDRTVHQP